MVVGLTGPNASGKGESASYLKSKGFVYHSLSDILREESRKLGIEPLRENLIKLGNDLRQKNGAGFLAVRAMKGLRKTEDHIIDSIRNPAEIEIFRKIGDFILLGIDAPVEIRFKRSIERKRSGDARSLKEFIEKEDMENRNSLDNQQLNKCLQMADVIIINDSTIEEFHSKIDEALKRK